jgi:hypothetical protein
LCVRVVAMRVHVAVTKKKEQSWLFVCNCVCLCFVGSFELCEQEEAVGCFCVCVFACGVSLREETGARRRRV